MPDLEDQLRSCNEALEIAPNAAKAAKLHTQKSKLLKELGRFGEAEASIRCAIALTAPSVKLLRVLSNLLRRQGRYHAAARALEEALALTHEPDRHRDEELIRLLVMARRFSDAARAAARLLADAPNAQLASLMTRALEGLVADAEAGISPTARRRLEIAAENLRDGRPVDAERALIEMVAQHPRWREAWVLLHGAQLAQGRLVEADATLVEWSRAAPNDSAPIEVIRARRIGTRGLIFDPREPLRLRSINTLPKVDTFNDRFAQHDSVMILDPGGEPVYHEPIISIEDDGRDWFAVKTETSQSFVAAVGNAALVGRGLVVTRDNDVIVDTLLPNAGKHGAVIRDGRLWPDLEHHADGGMSIVWRDQPAILMAGPTDASFGDWLSRFLPRLALARDAGLNLPLVVSSEIPRRHVEVLMRFGYDQSHIVRHDPRGISMFPRLFVPSWPTPDRWRPMKDWNRVFEPVARESAMQSTGAKTGERGEMRRPLLYVARTRIARRRLTNESGIIDLFAARGFQIIHPQDMSWSEVLHLFARPAIVAGPYGSALRNLAFCHEKPLALVMFAPYDEEFLRGSALWLAEMGVRFAYVRGRAADEGQDVDPVKAPFIVDAAVVERALDRLLARIADRAG